MEDDQQFCLRWNNHQSTLVAVFDTLLENGTLVDCTLAAEGKYLNAHKVVLSACSPYFESLLSQNYDKHPIFILKDVKYQELKAMMDYMYRGEVNISQDQLGALLKAAESLQIKGLSDNRKGETETRKTVAPPPPPAKSPPPATSIPRVQGLTIEQRRREMEESREGSQSPGARKKKRIRRRSLDDLVDNHHDASNSSESHHSSQAPVQNIPTTLPAAPSKIATDVPEPIETKSDILTRHKSTTESEVPQVPIIKEKIETHSELMLEPKAEYIEEMNEDSIEDLTLDDDDISNMEQMDDQGAGPSHGNMGEGSGQGFGGWHMGNQSQDEVFLAAQEAVGAHRDSQATPSTSFYGSNTSGALLTKSEHNFSFVNIPEFIPNPSFDVPRIKVAKSLGGTNVLAVSKKSLVTSHHGKTKNQQDVMKVLMAIRQQNAQVIEQNQNILTSFGINSKDAMLNFHLPVELPVTNTEELMSLENYINSIENFKSFVAFLVKLGGKDITSKTNRMLKTILTDTEAKNYNFYGKRGLKKAFSVLKLRSAIVEAVKLGDITATDKEVEDAIKVWLKHAPEREKSKSNSATYNM